MNFVLSSITCIALVKGDMKKDNLLRTESYFKKNGNEEGERKTATTKKENRIYD